MRPDPIHWIERGHGPPLVLVHGSATTAETFTPQLVGLASRFRVLAPNRRGAPRSPLQEGMPEPKVDDHVADLVDGLDARGHREILIAGSSFGAVVALEFTRRFPERVVGLVLAEPPLASSDDAPPVPAAFQAEFDAHFRSGGGPAAAEFFLRTVIGDASFEAMPSRWREKALKLHPPILYDCRALAEYRPRYGTLDVRVPCLLVGGARSQPLFARTLDALEAHLPDVQRVLLNGGHMMHVEDPRGFDAAITAWARAY